MRASPFCGGPCAAHAARAARGAKYVSLHDKVMHAGAASGLVPASLSRDAPSALVPTPGPLTRAGAPQRAGTIHWHHHDRGWQGEEGQHRL